MGLYNENAAEIIQFLTSDNYCNGSIIQRTLFFYKVIRKLTYPTFRTHSPRHLWPLRSPATHPFLPPLDCLLTAWGSHRERRQYAHSGKELAPWSSNAKLSFGPGSPVRSGGFLGLLCYAP